MGGEKKKVLSTVIMPIFGVIFVVSILLLVISSFKPYNDMIQDFLSFPESLYLRNYVTTMKRMDFFRVSFNSVIIMAGTVVTGMMVSFMTTYGISHLRGKVSTGFYLLFTLGQIVPFHTIMIVLSVMTAKVKMNNSFLVLICLYTGFHCVFGIFTYVGFSKPIPKELEEATAINGCGAFRTVWQVIFPLVGPTSITTGVLFFLWTWNDLLMPSLMLSDPSKRTLTVMMYLFKSNASSEWNPLVAALTLSILPVILLYICVQKYITSNITAGAIKM